MVARNKVTCAFAGIDLTGEPTLHLGEVAEGNSAKTAGYRVQYRCKSDAAWSKWNAKSHKIS